MPAADDERAWRKAHPGKRGRPRAFEPLPPPGSFTLPTPVLQRRLRSLIGAASGLCLSDVARYIGRPYFQVRALAYGERRMSEADQVALTALFSRFVDSSQEVAENVPRGSPNRQFRLEMTPTGPRLKR